MTETASFLMASTCHEGWDKHLPTLLNQTTPPHEVIVVIDRVTTADEQKALSTANPQVTFIFNTRNMGLTASLNRGIAVSTGDVIFRIDDDDACAPDRVEKQLKALEDNDADICCSFASGFNEGAETATWLIKHPKDPEQLKKALLKRNVMVHSTIAVRRRAFEALQGYDESFRYAQDYALYLKALRLNLIFAVVDEPLVKRAYSPNSITVAKRQTQIMFSSTARLMHAASTGDTDDFLSTMFQRGLLLSTPNQLRQFRRQLFKLVGRGA